MHATPNRTDRTVPQRKTTAWYDKHVSGQRVGEGCPAPTDFQHGTSRCGVMSVGGWKSIRQDGGMVNMGMVWHARLFFRGSGQPDPLT